MDKGLLCAAEAPAWLRPLGWIGGTLKRLVLNFLSVSLLLCAALPCPAQFKTELMNQDGATAPCTGIGPIGGPLAKKCVEMFEQAGFLRADQVGVSGLKISSKASIDSVDANSAAASAGLSAGDVIEAVDGKSVVPEPRMVAAKALFGPRGGAVSVTVRRAGAEVTASLTRDAASAPPGPKSSNFFVSVKPLIDWRGQFVPCMGAGPAGPAALEYCDHHFKPFGFIKTGEFGTTGLELDAARKDGAFIAAVAHGSAAEKAVLQSGDEIIAVEGKPLTPNSGEVAMELLFGKAGEHKLVKVMSGQQEKTVDLQLSAKAQN